MPASLESISIRGIRSYGPNEYKTQDIEFFPLTLIIGANGSGKTTIVEALKFVISGEEPPLSEGRRNFLHMGGDPIISFTNKKGPYASIKLQFTTGKDEKCIAVREILKATTKTATPGIQSHYRIGNKQIVQVHKQDDWLKIIPKLFNLPNQALLNNVILCHQENSLWCMGDSSSVKQVFDKLFGCEQYKREIKNIDAEIKSSKTDQALAEKDLIYLRDKLEQFKRFETQLQDSHQEITNIDQELKELDNKIREYTEKRTLIEDEISKTKQDTNELEDKLLREVQSISRQLSEAQANCHGLTQRIKVKENFVQRLKEQLKHTDPIGKDLAKVTENLNEMSIITSEMDQTLQVQSLDKLISGSEKLVEDVMVQFKTGNVAKIKADLAKEESEIETSKVLLKTSETNRDDLKSKHVKLQEEHSKVRHQGQKSTIGQDDLRNIENKVVQMRDKRSKLTGTKSQIQRDQSRIKSELAQQAKTKCKYAEALGKVSCNEIVVKDLEKLKQCFQQSITTFHEQMIIRVNEVLKARWRQIYQGNDIERIELVDEEITKGKDKKSFYYHIAMRKGGVRMKMREKSSAGQRALASIILRMTLAELFVKDFAFIALDEPTANLDKENVKALAKSIAGYVKRRAKSGSNIQWIIITHDDHFLREIDRECSPYYYKLELDKDGCSKINKISFNEMPEHILSSQI